MVIVTVIVAVIVVVLILILILILLLLLRRRKRRRRRQIMKIVRLISPGRGTGEPGTWPPRVCAPRTKHSYD